MPHPPSARRHGSGRQNAHPRPGSQYTSVDLGTCRACRNSARRTPGRNPPVWVGPATPSSSGDLRWQSERRALLRTPDHRFASRCPALFGRPRISLQCSCRASSSIPTATASHVPEGCSVAPDFDGMPGPTESVALVATAVAERALGREWETYPRWGMRRETDPRGATTEPRVWICPHIWHGAPAAPDNPENGQGPGPALFRLTWAFVVRADVSAGCALGRIRTCDTGFRRAVLYPLSY
jgi:hypothetical protein